MVLCQRSDRFADRGHPSDNNPRRSEHLVRIRPTMSTSLTPAIRAHSPDHQPGSERKRRRKVLSCYDCRRRKLQCDRALPSCGRCTKAGQAANCLYLDEGIEPPPDRATRAVCQAPDSQVRQIPASTGDALARLEYQERRIKQLEAALAQSGQFQAAGVDALSHTKTPKLPLTPESAAAAAAATGDPGLIATDRETILLRGKAFKTQFYGSTAPGAIIAHIPDLNLFTRETFDKFPALSRIRHEMQALEDRTNYAGSQSLPRTGDELKAMLPNRAETDDLVRLYLDSYGSIYHVLHLPTFWRDYTEMWLDISKASPHLVATVLLMLASVQCLTTVQPWLYMANSSEAREKAITYIQAVEDWLQTQSQKHVTSADFQIRFLIFFARQVSARKFKRTFTEAGTLVRFCMSAGLHRNPDLLRKKTSVLDKELRRRIWAAVVEVELQASFDRGMLATAWPQQSDCPGPSNIDDNDLTPEAERPPPPARQSDFTPSSYLSIASETITLRHGLNALMNNIRHTTTFEEVKRVTEEIDAHIQGVPDWIGTSAEAPKAMLSLSLRQYVLVLHDRQLRLAETQAEGSFSRMIIIDNATKIIELHRSLIDHGRPALSLLCQDQFRAALSVFQVACGLNINLESAMGQVIEQHAGKVMQEAIEMLLNKVIRFGREQRQLWIILAAHGCFKSRKDPGQREVYMQEAVDKITRPYYKIMACQKDMPPPAADMSEKRADRTDMPNGALEYFPPVAQPKPGELEGMDPIFEDIDEIEAWTLENWAFNTEELQQAFSGAYGALPP